LLLEAHLGSAAAASLWRLALHSPAACAAAAAVVLLSLQMMMVFSSLLGWLGGAFFDAGKHEGSPQAQRNQAQHKLARPTPSRFARRWSSLI